MTRQPIGDAVHCCTAKKCRKPYGHDGGVHVVERNHARVTVFYRPLKKPKALPHDQMVKGMPKRAHFERVKATILREREITAQLERQARVEQ